MALHTGQVVLQYSLGVDQQAANEGAFAIVNRATGDKFKGVGH
jgi:hypothetical protein